MTSRVIGFAGMTHLGLNSAAAAADKGFETVCYDPDPQQIARLSRHELPIVEPDLPQLIEKNARRIRFTADPQELTSCELVYVASDVPTDDLGNSDLGAINALISRIDAVLRPDAVLIILSQVPPGFTRGRLRAGRPLYYQVETLIFGRAVERALHPERVIVGCAEPERSLPPAFARFLESFGCPILPMRYESAELAKISINMCLVASVSVANTLAELCEEIGADWLEIVPALKLDKRIGQYSYLSPGLGIAGGNLERDLATVCSLSELHGTDDRVVRAWIANSRHRRDWVLRMLHREVLASLRDPVIAVLGLAYKQDTNSTKNSASFALLEHLGPFRVRLFDPAVSGVSAGHPRFHDAHSELEACEGAHALALMTPWPQFGKLDAAEIARRMRGRIVVDPYAMLNAPACKKAGLRHFTLGVRH